MIRATVGTHAYEIRLEVSERDNIYMSLCHDERTRNLHCSNSDMNEHDPLL